MKHPCVIKSSGHVPPPVPATMSPDGLDLAVLRGLQWPNGTVLRVAFMERIAPDLRRLIVQHLNAWNRRGVNIAFVESPAEPQIRITLARGQGYWSYLGVDCLHISKDQPTMALEGFTTRTAPVELARVIRHEAGHTLGFPHEHSRREIVARLDPAKVIAFFKRHQGWDEATIRDQILTTLPQTSIIGTRLPDPQSIMAYSFGANLTRDGRAIPGGTDITALDAKFAASIYPMVRR